MMKGISVDEMMSGIQLNRKNAERLLQDSLYLFDNGKLASSYLLSQLCLEEQAKAFRLIKQQLRRRDFSRKNWEDFAYSHEGKLMYIQKVNDELDADMVRQSTGIDFWQVLRKMYQGQGQRTLEGYRKKVSRDMVKFRNMKLYTDYNFEMGNWTDANQIDQVTCFRSKMMAERLMMYLEHRIRKLEAVVHE